MSELKNTVQDLIDRLSTLDPDALVVFSKDAEGNRFSPWAGTEGGWSDGKYEPDSTWSGEYYSDDDEEYISDGARAVCLWPIS